MFRIPDLPIVGYATQKERIGTDAIMNFLRKIERDRERLLTIVSAGPDKWRTVARDIWRGSAVDDEKIDEIYRYLLLMAAKPQDQVRILATVNNAAQYAEVVTSIRPDIEAQLETVKLERKWLA